MESLAYLLLEFPLGIFSFTSVVTVVAFAAGLTLSPVEYFGSLAPHTGPGSHHVLRLGFGIAISDLDIPLVIVTTLALSALGILLLIGSLQAFNGLAFIWGQFARLILGMSDRARRLAEARAAAPLALSRIVRLLALR